MTLEIIGFPRSNFVRTVRMAAHEKGVAYEYIQALPHSDEVKAIHPLGQIPVMRHDGLELAESQAITRYLDSAFDGPKLIPEDPRKAAIINQWVSMTATSIDQLLIRRYVVEFLFNKDSDGNVNRSEIDKSIKRFPKIFGMLNGAVADGFFGNDSFSLADCFLMPMVTGARNFPEAKDEIEKNTALSDYIDRVSERPCFVETAS
ncbi:glutathione S-transferase family protein [Sneathiella marina]|uniref:Glutathione S-transferase family protein n=1 Tax=Sneathiella marina TaxID=2950108 RepID=A0ABY4W1R5_9PROT|nr:glutathione S-transferase family protein [Sneathiella marina]USG60894.1 glutathione S-transferase family protein [Sneathiella marina]